MKIITAIWIAACLFMAIALVTSAITVVPAKGQWIAVVSAISALLSLTAGLSGIALGVLHKRRPESSVFRSKGLLGAVIAAIAVLALLLILVTAG